MSRLVAFWCLAVCLLPRCAFSAEEYLIHVDAVGYRDSPVKNPVPRDEIQSSFQFLIRSGISFQGRSAVKNEVFVIKGLLRPAEQDRFQLKLATSLSQEDPAASVTIRGVKIPGVQSAKSETEVELKLGQRIVVGGFASIHRIEGQEEKRSKVEFRVRVTKYDPDQETPEGTEESDKKYLSGHWDAFELIEDGARAPDDSAKQFKIVVQGNAMIVQGPETTFGTQVFDFKLDAETVPKRIAMTAADGKNLGHTAVSLYDLSTRDLQILLPDFEYQELPEKLESEVGSKRVLLRLSKFQKK